VITTKRLTLRPWREEDRDDFHAIINTPAMMEHFGGVTPRADIDAIIDAQIEGQARDGFCMWAVELRDTGALAGVCGLRRMPRPDTPVTGDLEIGWRIGEAHWGAGVAREAAQASLSWGWANTDLPRCIAYTTQENRRSWGLMLRLGMTRRPDLDFRHPNYASDDPVGAMIVYAIARPA
jgi:RimJ/RimL family protein N-acetyltransferase